MKFESTLLKYLHFIYIFLQLIKPKEGASLYLCKMKKTYLYTHVCSLLFIMIFITSCSGQEKSNLSKDNQLTTESLFVLNAYSDPQIAEYIRNIFQDKNGHLWFGTNGYGVAHFNGDSLSYFSNEQGFSGVKSKV